MLLFLNPTDITVTHPTNPNLPYSRLFTLRGKLRENPLAMTSLHSQTSEEQLKLFYQRHCPTTPK